MLNPGTYLQNHYEILERIGSDGMSVVYKARCHILNRPVAIKVLKEEFAFDDNFVSKFKMEAQAAARLPYPNTVSVYDVVDEDVLHYIVVELVGGITLKNYIEKKGHLGSKEAIGTAIQVGQGIAAVHEQRIIHRDIKPQNMIIFRNGKVKVADFGIARIVSTQTTNVTAVRSVHYISSEQARGGYYDERSDIYSFGITMYEMVTGKVPFEGDNTVTVVLAHLEEPVRRPSGLVPDLSHALEQIVLKCTQKRPGRRYSDVLDVIGDPRKALMNPGCDIYDLEEGDELGETRSISREELINMQESRRAGRENERSEEELKDDAPKPVSHEKGKRRGNGHLSSRKNPEKDVSTQFERIVTGISTVAATLIVAVVLFVFSRLTGLFRIGTDEKPTVTVNVETATESVEVNITNNQTYVPSVLKMTEEKAREELEKAGLKMEVTGTDFPDNVAEGLVMSQMFDKDIVPEKGGVVGVAPGKGSDKMNLDELNLTVLIADNAAKLLEEKGLTVEIKEEFSNAAAAGVVLRFSPETARAGESVTLSASKGMQVVQGMVPELRGQNQTATDAMLTAAGFPPGDMTQEYSDTVAEGLIISQAVDAGTMLEPRTAADYVVNGESGLSQAESDQYCVVSINQTCSLSNYIGLTSQTSSARVMVRLRQTMPSGGEIYTPLIRERLVIDAQTIPVVIPRVRSAYGVDNDIVEVVDAGSANLTVIASYPVTLFPVGQGECMTGKIIKGITGFYYIHNGKDWVYECKAKDVFRNRKAKPLVGDNVESSVLDQEAGGDNIDAILPRSSALVRPAAANVGQTLVVFTLTHPTPNLNLLDRFLVMIGTQEVPVIICFSKAGLEDEDLVETYGKIYETTGCRMAFISTYEETGLEQVGKILGGKTTVLAGPSGVGKSSLTNCIQPCAAMETGDISQKVERGKYTTRHCELFYAGGDTYVMGTPGSSSMLTPDLEVGDLKDYFPEFSSYEDGYRFLDCVHVGERVYGVREALKAGGLSQSRYGSYLLMYEELKSKRRY